MIAYKETWVVYDGNGYPIYTASDKQMCHDHINDMVEHDIDGAAECVVRQVQPVQFTHAIGKDPVRINFGDSADGVRYTGSGSSDCGAMMSIQITPDRTHPTSVEDDTVFLRRRYDTRSNKH